MPMTGSGSTTVLAADDHAGFRGTLRKDVLAPPVVARLGRLARAGPLGRPLTAIDD
jgi:hypothetical protein